MYILFDITIHKKKKFIKIDESVHMESSCKCFTSATGILSTEKLSESMTARINKTSITQTKFYRNMIKYVEIGRLDALFKALQLIFLNILGVLMLYTCQILL